MSSSQLSQTRDQIVSGSCNHRRSGSGSFQGPEESDDEIQFRGLRRNSSRDVSLDGYQRYRVEKSYFTSYNFLSSRLDSLGPPASADEEKLKRKLKFFFMNPVEKYYATR